MKRRDFLKAAGLGMTASSVAAPAIAQSMPELKWRLTSSYPPGRWEGSTLNHAVVNLGKWNQLTPSYRSILQSACDRANVWVQAKYDANNPAALKRLVAAGVQFKMFPPAMLDACQKAAFELYAEVSATNADFRKVWENILTFRNDAYLWQVAEYNDDTYLIRTRTRV